MEQERSSARHRSNRNCTEKQLLYVAILQVKDYSKQSRFGLILNSLLNILLNMRINAFLVESPMFAINRASRTFDSFAKRTLFDNELSFIEGLILAAIFFESPDPITPSQLAKTFEMTRGNISHCISSLEAKDLLQRKVSPHDARAFLLTLKPAGKRAAVRVIGAFDRLQQSFERGVGKGALEDALRVVRQIERVVS